MNSFIFLGVVLALVFCLVYWLLIKNRHALPKWMSTWMIWPGMFDEVGKLSEKRQNQVAKRVAIGFLVMLCLIVIGYVVNGSGRH